MVALMIEKASAVKDLDAILSVPGIDMIVFGGNDYAMSVGRPRGLSREEIAEVRDQVFKTALSKGVQPRAEIRHPDQAVPLIEMGVRHFAIGTDLWMIKEWLDERAGGLRGML